MTLLRRGRGAWQGAAFGLPIGVLLGLVVGGLADLWEISHTHIAAPIAVGAVTGTAVGATFGAIKGSPDIYIVDD